MEVLMQLQIMLLCSFSLVHCKPVELAENWKGSPKKQSILQARPTDFRNEIYVSKRNAFGNCIPPGTDVPGFLCATSQECIPLSLVCDGVNDCDYDAYDETEESCKVVQCDGFLCPDGVCLLTEFVCDGTNDCRDGMDEMECSLNQCSGDQFQCRSGRCIPHFWRCDMLEDCQAGEDELECEHNQCQGDEFRCDTGACVIRIWVCDGQNDCPHAEDETVGCNLVPAVVCDEGLFQCEDQSCIPDYLVCDGNTNCPGGDDEQQACCNADEFRCQTGQCIPEQYRCDGLIRDCPAGEDEDCGCGVNEFQCDSGACIPDTNRCNNQIDCDDAGSDEASCPIIDPVCKAVGTVKCNNDDTTYNTGDVADTLYNIEQTLHRAEYLTEGEEIDNVASSATEEPSPLADRDQNLPKELSNKKLFQTAKKIMGDSIVNDLEEAITAARKTHKPEENQSNDVVDVVNNQDTRGNDVESDAEAGATGPGTYRRRKIVLSEDARKKLNLIGSLKNELSLKLKERRSKRIDKDGAVQANTEQGGMEDKHDALLSNGMLTRLVTLENALLNRKKKALQKR